MKGSICRFHDTDWKLIDTLALGEPVSPEVSNSNPTQTK
jgi:hypothetical protein